MSLMNLRNVLRALFQGDLMPLRSRASQLLDDMEYSTDAQAAAVWSGTGVTVTKTATKYEGNYAVQCVIDGTGNRKVSKTQTLNLSAFSKIRIWERCSVISSAIQFYLRDSSGNESYWNITTNGTANTWQQDELTLATPDSDSGTPASLAAITSWGFLGLDTSETYIFDTVKAVCGLNVAVSEGLVGSFYQQVYVGSTRITYAGGTSPTITAPTANPRIDLLTIDSAGTLAWTVGTEASSPAEPTFPSNKMPLCLVYCRVGMVKIVDYEDKDANPTEGYIYKDVRPIMQMLLGEYTSLLLGETIKPGAVADKGFVYCKDVSGTTELFYEDAAGNEIQMSSGGYIMLDKGRLPNNTQLLGKNSAGSGNIGLIKVNAADAVEIPDGAELASTAAPTAGAKIANKAYVDAQIAAAKLKYVKVSDTVASGVEPQANATDAWTTKRIQTEDSDNGALCSILSNQITLAAGTYFCRITSPVNYQSGSHQARLRNITDAATMLVGTPEYQHTDHDRGTQRSEIVGQFTIAAPKVFEVQHYKAAGTNWGYPANFGETEVYTVAEFWKLA